jgi:tetratricopeptide (TPR) repeat protein
MLSIPEANAMANQWYQAGHLQQAELLCRQILQADGNQADALHLLGLIAVQAGRADLGLEYIRQALRLRPDFAEAHSNLGNLLLAQGKPEEAEVSFRQALRLRPNFAEAHNNLGISLQQLGKWAEAIASLEQAVRLKPDYAEAHYNLGLGSQAQGKHAEAAAQFQEAVRLKPHYADAHNNLGIMLQALGKLEEAAVCLRQALALRPDFAGALSNLGNVLRDQGHPDQAEVSLRQALHFQPAWAEVHSNLGNAILDQGRPEEAVACYQQALRLKPDLADAHFYLGTTYLLLGKFAQGWPEYEWRLQMVSEPSSLGPVPRWDGSSLEGKTIVLRAEQGAGDTFQFIRYAALVQERGARVVVLSYPLLVPLLRTCPGIDHLLAFGEPLPSVDVSAHLLSLPLLMGTTLATVPAAVPYLSADPVLAARWREELGAVPEFKVGIVWKGSPRHPQDRQRSVSPTEFAPMAAVPGVSLVSLQVGKNSADEPALQDLGVIDLGSRFDANTFADAAAVVASLDLVVTVDTALAHLAGALGAPVWVALPFSPDWRWLLGREDSPWYPSMRLFRQPQPGQWSPVFERIAAELRRITWPQSLPDR